MPKRIVLLTYGSRGDVQPFLALSLRLLQRGYAVRLMAPLMSGSTLLSEFRHDFPERFEFIQLEGDIDRLAEAMAEAGMSALRTALAMGKFVLPLAERVYQMLMDACRDADLLVHTFAFTDGAHQVARSLGIPDISTQFFPIFTPTAQYPSMSMPDLRLPWGLTAAYRRWSHHANTLVFYRGGRLMYRRLRRKNPALPALGTWPFERPVAERPPLVFAFSRHVAPPDPGWPANVHTTGYWFQDELPSTNGATNTTNEATNTTNRASNTMNRAANDVNGAANGAASGMPGVVGGAEGAGGVGGVSVAAELVRFVEAGDPPLYIGFGSMLPRRAGEGAAQAALQLVLQALAELGQPRAVLALPGAGEWAVQAAQRGELPPNLLAIDGAPHSWLFPRMAVLAHHGGSGTTAAGLRAGVPTVITPFMGDQGFWAQRLEDLGVGLQTVPFKRLTAQLFARALQRALHDSEMRSRARALGERIRAEDGLGKMVALIESLLD